MPRSVGQQGVKTRIKFTVARLAAFPEPPSGRTYFYDTETPGLALCVTAAGARTYYFYKKVNGRPQRIRIARLDEITLAAARQRAKTLTGDIAAGRDPQAERIAKRGEITLGELFDDYLERHAKVHKKTWREDEGNFNRYVASWRGRPLSVIHRADVQALHAKLGRDNGIYAANRLLALLHKMFKHAADLGCELPNPAHGIKKFREQSRERFLQADEFPRFWAALDVEPNETLRDFFKLLLFTGARRSNVAAMRWERVNLTRGEWAIPTTKNGDPLTVALSPEAVAILKGRRAETKGSPWVFPSYGKSGRLADPKAGWAVVLKRAGIEDLRMHDLRRTLGSWQAAMGSSLHVVGKSLGHKHASTTMIYARLNLDPVRESVNRATTAMLAAAKAGEDSKNGE